MRITTAIAPDPTGTFDDLVTAITNAADAGFTRVWLPQMPPVAGVASWDALTTLAVVGARVPDVELGTGVVIAYPQHPLALARQALTVSAAVGGRLTLGIGVGHAQFIEAMGYDYDKPAAYLREYLQILIPALAGQTVEHHGARLTAVGQVDATGALPPPIVLAALGPRMLDLAGELADGTVTSWAGPRALEEHIIPRITKAAAQAGRPSPGVIAGLPVIVTSDSDSARALVATDFAIADGAPAYRAILDREGVASVADVCLIGDEDTVASQLRRFADIGVTEFVGSPLGDPATSQRTTELLTALAA